MTRDLPSAVPGSLAFFAGCYVGLEFAWCPPAFAMLLLALGLALRGRWGCMIGFLALGLMTGKLQAEPIPLPVADRPVTMGVEVTGAWRAEEDGVRALARGLWIRQGPSVAYWDERLQLVLPRGTSPPGPIRLRVKGYLRRPVPPANGIPARPGAWILRVKSKHFVVPESSAAGPAAELWRHMGDRVRRPIEERLSILEKRERGLGAALVRVLVLGQPDALPGSIARGLRAAGLAHLVALSGLHVGLLVGIVLIVTCGAPTRFRIVVAVSTALSYVLLAGSRPSLLRATLMMAAIMASWLLRRPPLSLNILSWVAAGMLIADPSLIRRLGFQLTVAATAGILILAARLERRWALLPRSLRQPLSVSVAAHLAVLPWALSVFHLATPLSPMWNLLAVPWAALSLAVAFAWVVSSITLPPLGWVLGRLLTLLAAPLEIFGSLPPTVLGAIPVGYEWWQASAVAGSLALFLLLSGRPRWAMGAAALLILTLGPRVESTEPELILLDVGQGEAILLRDGDEAFLVDGGGWRRADIAQRILLPALTRLGIQRLSGVILSHPDTDHCGGLLVLTSYMTVRRFYTSPGWFDDPCVSDLLTRPGLEIRSLWRGEQLRFARWHLRVLHPRSGTRSGRNNRSLVLLAETGGTKVLLTGDLEARGEREILDRTEPGDLRSVSILKIGHHGSDTSTSPEWLERLRPRIALISCGVSNRYGHPSPRVLKRLNDHRVMVLRTDLVGAIHISFGPGERLHMSFPGLPRERDGERPGRMGFAPR